MPYLCLWRHNFCAAGGVLLWFCQRNWAHPRFLWIIPPAYCQICRKQVYLQHKSKHSFLHRTPLTTYLPTDSEKPPRRGIDMLPPCLAVCFFTVSHGGSISQFSGVHCFRFWSVLIPVMPDVLDIVVLGRFMRKESSKIPLKINNFLCLRRFKVAFFLMWYVTILLDRFSITDAKAQVNSYCY